MILLSDSNAVCGDISGDDGGKGRRINEKRSQNCVRELR